MTLHYRESLIFFAVIFFVGCSSSSEVTGDGDINTVSDIVGESVDFGNIVSGGSLAGLGDIANVGGVGNGTNSVITPVENSDPSAPSLTIAIVNNGHMINMQTVAQNYTDQTGIALNWVALEEEVLRNQVVSNSVTDDGTQYDVINIGMQEAPIWGGR